MGLGGTIDMRNATPKDVMVLLDRNDYRVIMNKTDGGCLTIFPNRIELPGLEFTRLYQEFFSNGVSTATHDENGIELTTCIYPCPSYSHRLFTIYHAIYHCMCINYEMSYMRFMIKDAEVSGEAFFQEHSSPFMNSEDIVLENRLRTLIGMSLRHGFIPQHEQAAKKENILKGFQIKRNLFTDTTTEESQYE